MPAKRTSQFLLYGVSIVAVLFALVTRVLLNPVIGRDRYFFVTFLLAVVFAAWYCGVGPTILCVVLSALSAWLFVFSPESIAHNQPIFWGTTLSFGVISSVVTVVAESQRRVRGSLEARVNKRTAELVQANDNLKVLSVRLLELQDDERRRIARELHDSAGQLLAALSMNIGALSKMELTPTARRLQEDSSGLVQELLRQIRTLSHLLHPPLLDELGLLSAVRWYVDEFTARSGITVTLKTPQELPRLHRDTELTAFRVVQECLTNVHRHSESTTGLVEVIQNADLLEVTIRDYGKGISSLKQGRDVLKGVGLRSMEERIAQLGGRLEIESRGAGTEIKARLPVAHAPETMETPVRVHPDL